MVGKSGNLGPIYEAIARGSTRDDCGVEWDGESGDGKILLLSEAAKTLWIFIYAKGHESVILWIHPAKF
ncbi:hypothetical protein CapIbe_021698 [Capra ibex]